MVELQTSDWLLYGANGYTGQLIAHEAVKRGLRPCLAGRRAAAVQPLANALGLPCRIFALDDAEALRGALSDTRAILLAAGPFAQTSAPVRQACVETQRHYLDVTGELAVFDACRLQSAQAAAAGVVLLPGVGFDVVPSDCLAAALHGLLPNATQLTLAMHALTQISGGTLKTALQALAYGHGAERSAGVLRDAPLGRKQRSIPFIDKARLAVSVPAGDLVTAHLSTGIPNIEFYMTVAPQAARLLPHLGRLGPLLRRRVVHTAANALIGRFVQGPDAQARERGRSFLWGEARNAAGDSVQGWAQTPEGYGFTAVSAVSCMERLLSGQVPPGMQTPSRAFGSAFLESLPGCTLRLQMSHAS